MHTLIVGSQFGLVGAFFLVSALSAVIHPVRWFQRRQTVKRLMELCR